MMTKEEIQQLQLVVLLTNKGEIREQKLYGLEEAKNSQGEEREYCLKQYKDIRDNGVRNGG